MLSVWSIHLVERQGYFIDIFYFMNPLPHKPILGSSNSVANNNMMSKILTDGDTIF